MMALGPRVMRLSLAYLLVRKAPLFHCAGDPGQQKSSLLGIYGLINQLVGFMVELAILSSGKPATALANRGCWPGLQTLTSPARAQAGFVPSLLENCLLLFGIHRPEQASGRTAPALGSPATDSASDGMSSRASGCQNRSGEMKVHVSSARTYIQETGAPVQ